jgi:large subunit ribosomal protein L9
MSNIEIKKQEWMARELNNDKSAVLLMDKLKNIKLIIKKRVAYGDRLYDSVRIEHIIDAFKAFDIELKRQNVKIDNAIRTLGLHTIIVHTYGTYEVVVSIEVISDDASANV